MSKLIDLKNKRFGKLIVIKRVESRIYSSGRRTTQWLCKCDCGNEKIVIASSLLRGVTKSCGCLVREQLKTHNFSNKERLYTAWRNIRQRCNDKNTNCYKYYGGKGVKICKEWNDYVQFRNWAYANGYEEHLTIDRIDTNGDYCPENCRWVTMQEQANNKTNTYYISYNNQTKPIQEWAKEFNLLPDTIRRRINLGWQMDRVFNERPFIGKNQTFIKNT